MSQGAVILPTTPPLPGSTAVPDINTALAAVISKFSGSSSPTLGPGASGALVAGQDWLNTSATPFVLNIYDGAQWIPWLSINNATHALNLYIGPSTAGPDAPVTLNLNTGATAAPAAGTALHLIGPDATQSVILFDSYAFGGNIIFRSASNTRASPQAVTSGFNMGSFGWRGYGATGYPGGNRAVVRGIAEELWTDTAQGVRVEILTTTKTTTSSHTAVTCWGSGGVSIGATVTDPGANNLQITGTTAATSSTTGSATFAGGIGVAGNVWASGAIVAQSSGGQLHNITGTYSGTYAAILGNTHGSTGDFGIQVAAGAAGTTDASSKLIGFIDGGLSTLVGSITRNGASAVAYNTSSDIRGKPNRERLDLAAARAVVDRLTVWDFDRPENPIRGVGLIAQEAYAVSPAFATKPADPDEWWGAEKAAPVPYLIAALQLAHRRLDALEAQGC